MHPSHLASARARARLGTWQHLQWHDPERARLDLFPDFLILGPQRTGTTWLYHNLKKHPQIFLPRKKETYYFTTLGRPDHPHFEYDHLDDFLVHHLTERPRQRLKRHFDSLRHYGEFYRPSLRGEATATNALLPPDVIRELVAVNPDLKAVLMLRDPIERAWSHARKDLVRKHGRRPEDVPSADYARFFRASGQRGLASYGDLLRAWTRELKPGHVFVGDFEMIARDPECLLTGLHQFLGVRSGPRYFNRHLDERINPASAVEGGVPEAARERLNSLLAEEVDRYGELLQLLQSESADSQAIRDRFQIGPFATPLRPVVESE